MSETDLKKLQSEARYRLRALGFLAGGHTWRDLLHAAMVASVEPGERQWRRGIDFKRHLSMTMWSIASLWGKDAERTKPASAVTRVHADGGETNPVDDEQSREVLPDRHYRLRESVRELQQEFKGDKDEAKVLEIMDGLSAGLKAKDIRDLLHITRTEYEALMKKLRRRAEVILPKELRYD